MTLPTMETRVATLEAVQSQINDRLGNIEAELREIRVWIRWLIGIQITTLLTLGTLILVKLG